MNELAAALGRFVPDLWVFGFVLARAVGLFLVAPVLGSPLVAVRVRAGLALFVAVALTPVLARAGLPERSVAQPLGVLLGLAAEVSVGLAIGLAAQFLFSGVQMAGQLAGVQMGLGLASLIDPQTQERVTALAQWQQLAALLLFVTVDGHHQVVWALVDSFRAVPPGVVGFAGQGLGGLVVAAGSIFLVGLRIAAPVLVVVLMVNAAMGALTKLIPQLNVMIVGFGVNVAAGLFALAISEPFALRFVAGSFAGLRERLAEAVVALG